MYHSARTMRNSGCWCCISTIVPTYLALPSIPSFILCPQEMLREVKMPPIYFPEDRVTGCAGTGIGQVSVSSTHTTNPRHVKKKKKSRTLRLMWSSKVRLFIYFFLGFIFYLFIYFFICSEFCHTLKWKGLGFTCLPHPDPPSHLPPHPLPPGPPRALGPSACLMHPTWAGNMFHPW